MMIWGMRQCVCYMLPGKAVCILQREVEKFSGLRLRNMKQFRGGFLLLINSPL